MAARKRRDEAEETRRRPATTPEAREGQMVSLAMDLAERKLRDGTASSQEVTHFLKLGSSREKLEQQRLEHENELTKVKIDAVQQQGRIEELYKDAITAMQSYSGGGPPPESDVEDQEV